MLNRITGYTIIFLFALVGCKKVDYNIEREDGLSKDTAGFLYSCKYVSHNPSEIVIELSMATFNGLESETEYVDEHYDDTSVNYQNVVLHPGPENTYSPAATQYSSVFLFNKNNNEWYRQYHIGNYLRRYFEETESVSGYRTAMGAFSFDQSGLFELYKEDPQSLFNNSWEYNMDRFYDFARPEIYGDQNNSISLVQMINMLEDAIDSLIADPGITGQKSITVFIHESTDDNNPPYTDLDSLLQKAQLNQIKINYVGIGINWFFRHIAFISGGFVCDLASFWPEEQTVYYENTYYTGKIGNYFQNLDKILSNNLTVNRCNITFEFPEGNIYASGEYVNLTIVYDGRRHEISTKIP